MTIAVYNSLDRMVRMAMFDAGLIEEGADPTPDQTGNYVQRLLDIIQIWQLEGCKLFLMRDVVLPLVLNQDVYTIGPSSPSLNMVKPQRIESVYWVDAQRTTSRELFRVERYDWDRMPPAQSYGTITQFYEDRQIAWITLYLWNKPGQADVAGQLHLVVRAAAASAAVIADPITASFPIEWAMALRWSLAADISTGQPDSIVQRCERMAAYYKGILENFDVEEGGISFQPNLQGVQRSRFS